MDDQLADACVGFSCIGEADYEVGYVGDFDVLKDESPVGIHELMLILKVGTFADFSGVLAVFVEFQIEVRHEGGEGELFRCAVVDADRDLHFLGFGKIDEGEGGEVTVRAFFVAGDAVVYLIGHEGVGVSGSVSLAGVFGGCYVAEDADGVEGEYPPEKKDYDRDDGG